MFCLNFYLFLITYFFYQKNVWEKKVRYDKHEYN